MTPVFQTRGKGNCLQAAIATVLDRNLNEVPDFSAYDAPQWWKELSKWAISEGMGLVRFNLEPADNTIPDINNVWVIMVGKTSRNTINNDDHAVVCKAVGRDDLDVDFEFHHDPHHSQAMLDSDKLSYCFFFTRQ